MNTQENTNNKKTKRPRSPGYPHYTLQDCMVFLDSFIEKNSFTEAHKDVAVKYMGHSSTSSTADRVVAAMTYYGLLEYRGAKKDRFYWPSELAREIYKTKDDPIAHKKAIRKAVLRPDAMQIVWDKWGPSLPSREAMARSMLAELGFSRRGAERFSLVAESNYQYTGLKESGKIETAQKVEPKHTEPPKGKSEMIYDHEDTGDFTPPQFEKPEFPKGLKSYRIPVDNSRDFHFAAPADMTESEFEDVIELLASYYKKKLTR